jgi:NAD(P)-dependent dehydrogenase (short-subunit alcohol dehydrogenase family)
MTSLTAGARLLADRVVLVSGVGSGLGRSLALRSALAGADVVLAARTESTLQEVAGEVESLGRRALVVPTDLTDGAAVTGLVERALDAYGRVDALLNSAFFHPPTEELLSADLEAMRGSYEINVLAAVDLVQKLAPALVASRGAVVLVNSMVIRNRLPGFGAYRMNKASLLAAARGLSVELGPRGVRVNSVGGVRGGGRQHRPAPAARAGRDRRRGRVPDLGYGPRHHRSVPGRHLRRDPPLNARVLFYVYLLKPEVM